MIKDQYGSFEIKSPVMLKILNELKTQQKKKIFVIIGEVGTGKTTMLHHINKIIFNNHQMNLFDGVPIPSQHLSSAIVTTSKKSAYEVIKRFDQDQLHVIEMPNLSERKADIPNFCMFFTEVLSLMNDKKICKLTEKANEKLLQYGWPGNFYELEAVLEKAFEISLFQNSKKQTGILIEPEHISLDFQIEELEFTIGQKLDEIERKYILQTLYFVHQNRTKAAEILGISIRTLRNKINQYREEGFL